jgi:hypothetical protein
VEGGTILEEGMTLEGVDDEREGGAVWEGGAVSQFPLALSPKTKRTRSYTSCENTHVTSGVNTRQTPSNLTGIRTMEITAWQLDALSSRDRRGSGRRGLSRRSGRVDILDLHQGR